MKLLKKMMSFSIVLSLCMIVGLFSNVMVASAAETEEGLVYYISSVSIEGGESQDMAVITGYKGDSPDVVIPEEINGYQVSIVYGFDYNGTIKTLTVLGDNVYFGSRTFYKCDNLEKVEFKQGIGYIEEYAFYECKKLTTVKNLKGLKAIRKEAFFGCSSLKSIELPETLTSIGEGAFNRCSSLQSIDIPKNVDSIGANAFYNCGNLTKINVASGNKNYTSVNGVLYTKDMKTLLRCPQAKTGDYSIPVGVTTIEDNAFYGSSLTSLNVPEGVVEIGKSAFVNSKFEKIVMPKSIDSIEDYWSYTNCFAGAENLVLYCVKNTFIAKYAINEDVKVNTDAHIGNFTATIKQPSFAYTGDYIKPVVTVKGKVNGKDVTLENWKDYKVTYKNFKNPGTASITITGRGKYVGELYLTFTIRPIADISKFSATIKQNTFTYTGEYIKPVVTVKGKVNGKEVTLANWKDYKITYKNFKNPGQATMTITGRGIYGGSKTITFYIRPTQVKNVKYVGKSTTYTNFKWDACVGVTGYEVYMSTSKNGTYTKVGTVSTTSFKNTGLKKGTTYYYKVRAYKTVGSTKLYGAYSSVYTLATSK